MADQGRFTLRAEPYGIRTMFLSSSVQPMSAWRKLALAAAAELSAIRHRRSTMRKIFVLFILLSVLSGCVGDRTDPTVKSAGNDPIPTSERRSQNAISERPAISEDNKDHIEWIVQGLKEIQKIKPGMVRSQLLAIFTVEGGISTRTNRTYVWRRCRYIKVDVEFKPVGDVRSHDESSSDVIVKISRPYLQWSIAD